MRRKINKSVSKSIIIMLLAFSIKKQLIKTFLPLGVVLGTVDKLCLAMMMIEKEE